MSETTEYQPADEQVFDYFLKELVSGQSPPDLSARIATAWAREQADLAAPASRSAGSQSALVELVQARPVQAQFVQARPVRSGLTTASTSIASAAPQPSTGTSLGRNVIATLLALCASGLLVLLSWRLVEQDRDFAQRLFELKLPQLQNSPSNHEITHSKAGPSEQLLAANGQPSDGTDTAGTDAASQLEGDSARSREKTDDQPRPFPLDRGLANQESPPVTSTESTASIGDLTLLDSQQIVAQIDKRLARLWQGLSITPNKHLDQAERAQRISLVLTGQPAINSENDLEQLITEATDSLPFARKWAEQFVALWLVDSNLPKDDVRLQALEKHFANSIYDGRPWNNAPRELLSGTIAADSSSQDAITSTFVSALAGNGNHRMVAAIGDSFLDVNLSCIRCHDASLSASGIERPTGTRSPNQVAYRQSEYWSLTAMLQGIDARKDADGRRVAVDRQAQLLAAGKPLTVYYDLIDGRLQAAEARLPDGQAWQAMSPADEVPRQVLAEWLSQTPAADAATVNQVWKMVFGQALIPHTPWQVVSPIERQIQVQRRELQHLLAQQYRAHGYDLKQLVGWIVRSDALRRQTTQPSREQWLAASAEQLQHWQLARENFATGARPTTAPADSSLEKTLLTLLQWREQSSNGSLETTLAQLAPSPASSDKPRQSSTNDAKASEISDKLAERRQLDFPPASDVAWVEHMLASQRLSWEKCVEHVAWLVPHRLSNSRFQSLADELLRHHQGDSRSALLDLIWAVRQ